MIAGLLLASTLYVGPTSCNDSGTCTSAGAPCCTPQGADTKASAGDTIIVQDGTYTDASVANDDTSAALDATGAWMLKISKANTTWQAEHNCSAIFDGENVNHGAIWVTVAGVTIDGFRFEDMAWKSTLRAGNIHVATSGGAAVAGTGVTIKNNCIVVTERGSELDHGSYGIRVETQNATIFNNTISGGYPVGIFLNGTTGTALYNVYGNTMTNDRTLSAATGITWEPGGGVSGDIAVIHDNRYERLNVDNGSGRCTYLRDHNGTIYYFNNLCIGSERGVYLQDDDAGNTEQAYIFNNTFIGNAFGAVFGIVWQSNYHADIRNNVFSGFGIALRLSTCSGSGCTTNSTAIDANDTFTHNYYTSTEKQNGTGSLPEPTISNNTTTACNLNASTYKLPGASGGCYNTGIVDPENGSDGSTCSVGGVNCNPDHDGNVRPASGASLWSRGFDEFDAGSPAQTTAIRRRIVRLGP